jgi:hypothetical protein
MGLWKNTGNYRQIQGINGEKRRLEGSGKSSKYYTRLGNYEGVYW